jgi:hypothetical protein
MIFGNNEKDNLLLEYDCMRGVDKCVWESYSRKTAIATKK